MILVTLEGLPHAGKCRVLRHLVEARPDWVATNVAPDPQGPLSWASSSCRTGYSLFAGLMRQLSPVASLGATEGVVLLNCPWYEHLPQQECLWDLLRDVTRELVACLPCRVDRHVMVMLHVPPDETFEQMITCGSPCWNGTSLADVRAVAARIRDQLDRPEGHPFPAAATHVQCPPFFEEVEVAWRAVVAHVQAAVAEISEA